MVIAVTTPLTIVAVATGGVTAVPPPVNVTTGGLV